MGILTTIGVKIVGTVVKKASPEIRKEILKYVKQLEVKAKATPNKWDDVLIVLLKTVLDAK